MTGSPHICAEAFVKEFWELGASLAVATASGPVIHNLPWKNLYSSFCEVEREPSAASFTHLRIALQSFQHSFVSSECPTTLATRMTCWVQHPTSLPTLAPGLTNDHLQENIIHIATRREVTQLLRHPEAEDFIRGFVRHACRLLNTKVLLGILMDWRVICSAKKVADARHNVMVYDRRARIHDRVTAPEIRRLAFECQVQKMELSFSRTCLQTQQLFRSLLRLSLRWNLYLSRQRSRESALQRVMHYMGKEKDFDQFRSLLNHLIGQGEALADMVEAAGGCEGILMMLPASILGDISRYGGAAWVLLMDNLLLEMPVLGLMAAILQARVWDVLSSGAEVNDSVRLFGENEPRLGSTCVLDLLSSRPSCWPF